MNTTKTLLLINQSTQKNTLLSINHFNKNISVAINPSKILSYQSIYPTKYFDIN